MTETIMRPRIDPRIETETLPAERLEAELAVLPPTAPIPLGNVSLGLAGVGTLGIGLAGLWCAGFVEDQFTRGPVSGWLTVAVSVAGFALVGAALWRELAALFQIASVDRLRRTLASGELRRMRDAARRWATDLGMRELVGAIDGVDTPEALLALLRAGPQATLRARADALSRAAALQMGATIAVMPAPALDAAAMAWRGIRLVRQVAELHGMRPGVLGTIALLRRTAVSSAAVAATEFAVNAATHALLSHPLLERVLGDVAGAGIAARRMLLLGRAAALACSPVPPR